jgi:transcriptional regulator with XRE-family HTH domain
MQVNAEFVRAERQRRGWTQEVLAEIAGLSLRTVQRIESQGLASQESLSSLCVALEAQREQLLGNGPAAVARSRLRWLVVVAALGGAAAGAAVTMLLT